MEENTLKRYRLVWCDGKREVVTGYDIADAVRRAGYGGGATRVLDYWEALPDAEHS